jgi:hypothetical protein
VSELDELRAKVARFPKSHSRAVTRLPTTAIAFERAATDAQRSSQLVGALSAAISSASRDPSSTRTS